MISETEVQLLQLRVTELEEGLKFLYRRLNIDFAQRGSTPELAPAVQDALRSGNKIAAIKLYRELTNSGLAEAKEAIERAEQFLK